MKGCMSSRGRGAQLVHLELRLQGPPPSYTTAHMAPWGRGFLKLFPQVYSRCSPNKHVLSVLTAFTCQMQF